MRTCTSIATLTCALAVLVLGAAPHAVQRASATPPARPRLIVLIVVDQLRADYIDLYGQHWTGGLRRLLTNGAVFPKATYPYAITRTCAGHGSISGSIGL